MTDDLLILARGVLTRADLVPVGYWARASSLLARQALEGALRVFWSKRAPGLEDGPVRAQLLCLGRYVGDERLAGDAHQVWGALSRACHYHAYELPPTADELERWCDVVGRVIEVLRARLGSG